MSNKKGIALHAKHGLNPTLCTCFFCGEETGEIALLGAAYKGEAPRHMCIGLEPCAKCKEKYHGMVLIVEVDVSETPTGRWVAIPKDAVTVEHNSRVCLATPETFKYLLKQLNAA